MVNRDLAALSAAFAASPNGLPNFIAIRAGTGRPNVWPLFTFLHNAHYTATLPRRSARLAQLPSFPLAWKDYLPALGRRFPIR